MFHVPIFVRSKIVPAACGMVLSIVSSTTTLAAEPAARLPVEQMRPQTRIWKWQPSYDPPPTLRPILESKGISIAQWRFCEAIRYRTRELALKLLLEGADPSALCEMVSGGGIPPIFFALTSENADPEIVKALVGKGANINSRYTPNPTPHLENTTPMEKIYFSKLMASQNTDYFPLYYAVKHTNPKIAELVIQLGADINARTKVHQMTALFAARDVETAKVLLKYGAKINEKDTSGRSVLKAVKESLSLLSKGHYLRPKVEAYVEWLGAQGAYE